MHLFVKKIIFLSYFFKLVLLCYQSIALAYKLHHFMLISKLFHVFYVIVYLSSHVPLCLHRNKPQIKTTHIQQFICTRYHVCSPIDFRSFCTTDCPSTWSYCPSHLHYDKICKKFTNQIYNTHETYTYICIRMYVQRPLCYVRYSSEEEEVVEETKE